MPSQYGAPVQSEPLLIWFWNFHPGGTADMSAHEILKDGSLKEIHRATGDALGGNTVDESFNRIMGEIVGVENMLDFFHDYRQDYVEFMVEFAAPCCFVYTVFKLTCSATVTRGFTCSHCCFYRAPYTAHISIFVWPLRRGRRPPWDFRTDSPTLQLLRFCINQVVQNLKQCKPAAIL